MRIYPDHFWTARRFIPAIMPATLLFAAGAAFSPWTFGGTVVSGAWRRVRTAVPGVVGLLLIAFLAWQFWARTQPILDHVEYAGLIPRLEQLVSGIDDRDLVLVEARESSDLHVLALPFAYTYARNVLVLSGARPDRADFRAFLAWAKGRYRRVLFMGSGGTDVLSRSISVTPIADERFEVPQYEVAYLAYPRSVRYVPFAIGIYELVPQPSDAEGLDVDVGVLDDLYVRRFHAKETHANGTRFRWSRDNSYVSILGGTPDTRTLSIWMTNGGRPTSVPPATVTVTLDDYELGTVTVTSEHRPYRFELPPALALELAGRDNPGQLRLSTNTWNPGEVLGVADPREMGVMVDRITLEAAAQAP